MLKKIIATLVLLAFIVAGTLFAVNRTLVGSHEQGKLRVVASYYPLYDFAQNVGGNLVYVTTITPAGSEPHEYEPSPKALGDAQKADVFVYNGAHMEPWVTGFLSDYHHTAIKASQGIALHTIADEEHTTESVRDPHFWLDPVLAAHIVDTIRDGLSKADPAHKEIYAKNAAEYTAKLAQLDSDFKDGLANCQTRTIITSHAAFGYLATRYNIRVASIAGVTPDEEPSAATLAELSKLVREQGIQYVFFESLVSPRLADTIASETGAKTLVFDPIEGLNNADQKQGKNYLSVQRENLANLRTALACR